MYLVGNPRPTNPKERYAVAKRRGWLILKFNSRAVWASGGSCDTCRSEHHRPGSRPAR